MRITRRQFLLGATGLTAVVGTGVSVIKNTTDTIEVSHRQFPINGYKGSPVRIGFLSDFHLGPGIAKETIIKALTLAQTYKPDVLLLGGDYLWIPNSPMSSYFPLERNAQLSSLKKNELPEATFEQLSEILQPFSFPHGTYAVYGNHDRWIEPKICHDAFSSSRVDLLVNEVVKLDIRGTRLKIYGTDDYWTGVPKPPPFHKAHEEDELRIVLTHNPDYHGELLKKENIHYHLGLCGHTHGGQICLPLFGAPTYNITDQRFRVGEARVADTIIYTSRGIGVVEIPYRFNCPAEVAIIDLMAV